MHAASYTIPGLHRNNGQQVWRYEGQLWPRRKVPCRTLQRSPAVSILLDLSDDNDTIRSAAVLFPNIHCIHKGTGSGVGHILHFPLGFRCSGGKLFYWRHTMVASATRLRRRKIPLRGRLAAPPRRVAGPPALAWFHCAGGTALIRRVSQAEGDGKLVKIGPYRGTGPKIASARRSKAEAKRRKAVSNIAPISIASVRLRNS
jgi:hypothetical protein